MSMNDPLANALATIQSYDRLGKQECLIKPVSRLIIEVIKVMKGSGYVGDHQVIDDGKGGMLKLNLMGWTNKCSVIKPRYPVSKDTYEKYEKRFLPAVNFGILIVSTSQGVMTHTKAKEKGIGGKLLAFCY